MKVTKTRIIGTRIDVFDAWMPIAQRISRSVDGRFANDPNYASTIATIGDEWYGRVGTDPDRRVFDAMPRGDERIDACHKAYADRYEIAYTAIIAEYPEAEFGKRNMGQIEIIESA